MNLFMTLAELAVIPSQAGREHKVRDRISDMLRDHTDKIQIDAHGNMYAIKMGKKDGTVMLCAHMDKDLVHNHLGWAREIKSSNKVSKLNLRDISFMEIALSAKSRLFAYTTIAGYEKIEADADSVEGRSIIVDTPKSIIGNGELFSVYALPLIEDKRGKINGKIADTLGLALALEAIIDSNVKEIPNIITLFTTRRKDGELIEPAYCVRTSFMNREYLPDAIIVLDTTNREKVGDGILMCADCGRRNDYSSLPESRFADNPAVGLENSIRAYANTLIGKGMLKGFRILISDYDEARIFAQTTNIPTVALKVAVTGMNSAEESCDTKDVMDMRSFLNGYLRNVLFEGITEVKK